VCNFVSKIVLKLAYEHLSIQKKFPGGSTPAPPLTRGGEGKKKGKGRERGKQPPLFNKGLRPRLQGGRGWRRKEKAQEGTERKGRERGKGMERKGGERKKGFGEREVTRTSQASGTNRRPWLRVLLVLGIHLAFTLQIAPSSPGFYYLSTLVLAQLQGLFGFHWVSVEIRLPPSEFMPLDLVM
jgi:hypothetical protein